MDLTCPRHDALRCLERYVGYVPALFVLDRVTQLQPFGHSAYTHPNEPKVDYPKDFQGINIPVHGPSIAKVIEDRIDGKFVTTPKP